MNEKNHQERAPLPETVPAAEPHLTEAQAWQKGQELLNRAADRLQQAAVAMHDVMAALRGMDPKDAAPFLAELGKLESGLISANNARSKIFRQAA